MRKNIIICIFHDAIVKTHNYGMHQTILTNGTQLDRLLLQNYPQVIDKFTQNLEHFIVEIPNILIEDVENFVTPLSSELWRVGHAIYKEHNLDLAKKYEQMIELKPIDKEMIFGRIQDHILKYSNYLLLTLKLYQYAYKMKVNNLESFTIKDLLEQPEVKDEEWLQGALEKIHQFKIKRPMSEKDRKILEALRRIFEERIFDVVEFDKVMSGRGKMK